LEVSALKYQGGIGLHGRSPLLRLQSDERLIALLRRGNTGAFEVLVSRYESRLLAFCRHMLRSREDAEDVLQEVMTAAFNAIVADDRPINVRPWLYRIARNRSLNHLRKAQAIGVDSMDHHLSEHGTTTADKVHEREEFRMLVGDIHDLPETQKTALVLREMDALSYEQISEAMETTVSSVKSLLVRARVSLAEAAEARLLSCEEVRIELGEIAEGLRKKPTPLVRRHLRDCKRCATFRTQLKQTNKALAVLLPVGPLVVFKKLAFLHLGHSAGAGAGSTAAGSTAGAGAGAAIGASGVFGGGSIVSAGMGAVATKAAAGLAAAAIVTAGAVEVDHHHTAHHPAAPVASALVPAAPSPIAPVQSYAEKPSTVAAARTRTHKAVHHAAVTKTAAVVRLPVVATVAAPTTTTTMPVTTTPTATTPTTTTPPGRVQTQTDPTIIPPPTTPPPAPPLATPTTPAVPTTPAAPVTTTVPVTPTVPVTTAPAPPTTAPTTTPTTPTATTPTPTSTPTTPVVAPPADPLTPTTPTGTPPTAPPTTPTGTTPTAPPTTPAPPVTLGTTTVGAPPLTVTVP
jgi:RNA polymerase sigma factor (sigma-70 family)